MKPQAQKIKEKLMYEKYMKEMDEYNEDISQIDEDNLDIDNSNFGIGLREEAKL